MSVQLETRGDHVYVNNQASGSGGPGHRTSVTIIEDGEEKRQSAASLSKSDVESDFELLANDSKKRPVPRPVGPSSRPTTPSPEEKPPAPANAPPSSHQTNDPTEDEMLARTRRKMKLLNELQVKTGNPRKLTMESSMNDIVLEHESATSRLHTDQCLKVARSLLGFVCDGINHLNSRVDPFGVNMDEWKNDIKYKIAAKGEFDDALLQIVEEHKDLITISPWMQISMGLGFSFYAHLSVKKENIRLQAQLREQAEQMRRQEEEIRAHRMHTRRQEKEAWERNARRQDQTTPEPVPDLQGPALTAEEMRKAMESEFVPDNGREVNENVVDKSGGVAVAEAICDAREDLARAAESAVPSPIPSPVPAEKPKRKAGKKTSTVKAPAKRRTQKSSAVVALDL